MGDAMIEVYVNELPEPIILEEDGRLSLLPLNLDPNRISIHGKLGLVGPDGITKRTWRTLVQLFPKHAEGLDELGTKANPLQVAGTTALSGGSPLLRMSYKQQPWVVSWPARVNQYQQQSRPLP